MNNVIFGKTMKNFHDHVDIQLLKKWKGQYGANSLLTKPDFHRRIVYYFHYNGNFVATKIKTLKTKMDKPIYVEMAISDVSKIYTDNWFDTVCHYIGNKEKLGLMKDENN
ncbi:hypothetical protein V1478_002742 [Vespula squamosa]|uniref:Uncharacterized protein n=1 Tax=Vespula squamosa TaxID=30214 RepID=A0ABD2BSH3_VESSQ